MLIQKTKIKTIMKKIAIALFLVSFLTACGNNNSTENTTTDSTSVTAPVDTNAVVVDSTVVDTNTVK